MTPSQMRDELAAIQDQLNRIEQVVDHQKQHRAGYHEVSHELVEAWEAVNRAMESLDEMSMGMA